MKAENKEFLEANLHHWITLRDSLYLRGLNASEREGMQRVMAEEFSPGYTTDLWCAPCVADMVRLLYTRYEQWKEQNKEPEIIKEEPLIVKANFPHNPKNSFSKNGKK
jgi:hypothetical protein